MKLDLAYFAAHAPGMPRDFAAMKMGWPTDLPEYDSLCNIAEERESWQEPAAKSKTDSIDARWKQLTPAERVELAIEWRWYYAKMMVSLQESYTPKAAPLTHERRKDE